MKTQLVLTSIAILIIASLNTGCVTKKVQTVTNGQTNTVTVVNQENLDLDAAALQGATSIATAFIVSKGNPADIAALKNAELAINGILNGANQQTTQQVIDLLKANGSATLQTQVSGLVQAASALEQKLLNKYGTTVAGQISVELTKAIYAGLVIGLAGK